MSNNPMFKYSEDHFGGTETMARGFIKHILPEMTNIRKYYPVIIPGHLPPIETVGADGNEYIFWIHNTINQFTPAVGRILNNPLVKKATKKVVSVSEYERTVLSKQLDISINGIVVIPNAIEPVVPNPDKFKNVDKVRIIHASTAERGMEILLKAVPLIEEDFELNIFNDFYPDLPHKYSLEGVNDPRVNFYGKTPRKTLYKFFADAHIHAYPSIYPETSCLTQMEALSAGCYAVYSDLGALPETSLGYGTMIPIEQLTPEMYAIKLSQAIRMIKEQGYDYTQQVEDIKNNFTWEVAKKNWLAFDETI